MGVTAKLKRRKGIQKVSRKKKRTGVLKAKVPQEILNEGDAVKKKLGVDAEWNKERTMEENYRRNGFAVNTNDKFGRQRFYKKKDEEAQQAAKERGLDLDWMDDDEVRALRAEERKTGKAAPKRLTDTQIKLVEALIAAHKDGVEAMARDIKINTYQHSAGQLRKLLASYAHWGPDWEKNGVDFRAPKKSKGGKMGRA